MPGLNNLNITRKAGGLGRRNPSEDMISGLVAHGVAVAGKLNLSQSYQLKSVAQAEALGIDAAYDTTNLVLLHYHISEFFRMNPDGELWILVAPQATVFADLADPTKAFGKKLVDDAGGKIRQLGIVFNPASGYTPVLLTGLDSQVLDTIAKAQLLKAQQEAEFAPLNIVVEGREFNGTAAAAKDLRTLASAGVSVAIGADGDVSATNPKHAAVGTVLGAISRAKVNESIAWVEKFNLTDVPLGKFLKAFLSSGLAIGTYDKASQDTLHDKGYIFVRTFPDLPGAYLTGSSTCAALTSDYCTIENNRTIDKASRLIRAALLPKLNSPVLVNKTSGKLKPEVSKSFEAAGRSSLEAMERNEEVSGIDVYVDPNQNILTTSELKVEFEITPTGKAENLKAEIGFKNPFN